MNILLFSPAILMLYLACLGIKKTILQLAVCGIVQVIIGAPFLLTHPISYIKGSFDLGRIFEHKWTVNYRFLDRATFEDKNFHVGLLIAHVGFLIIVARPCYLFFKNYARLRTLQAQFEPQIAAENREIEDIVRQKMRGIKKKVAANEEPLTLEQKKFLNSFEAGLKTQFGDQKQPPPVEIIEDDPKKVEIHFDQCVQLALLPIFLINFIGMMCARSLHYQFYVWYFHTLPYLSYFTEFHTSFKIILLFLIEFCWNQYPSTNFSSTLLHACHTILFMGLLHKLFKEVRLAKLASLLKEKSK
jgi:alpha-1,3-mannosyltransferase